MKQKGFSIRIFTLQILVCLFLNWAGERIVSALNLPLWFDSVGTVLAAWVMGPWCGAVIGATSGLLMYILYRIPWYYALISILGLPSSQRRLK